MISRNAICVRRWKWRVVFSAMSYVEGALLGRDSLLVKMKAQTTSPHRKKKKRDGWIYLQNENHRNARNRTISTDGSVAEQLSETFERSFLQS